MKLKEIMEHQTHENYFPQKSQDNLSFGQSVFHGFLKGWIIIFGLVVFFCLFAFFYLWGNIIYVAPVCYIMCFIMKPCYARDFLCMKKYYLIKLSAYRSA